MAKKKILVAGAGGFIGGHLTKRLLDMGHDVRAVDIKPMTDWFQIDPRAQSVSADLKLLENCVTAADGVHQIYNLAADMGGIGFIELHKAECMLSVLINTHLLQAAVMHRVERFFYSSSACVYAAGKQVNPNVVALKESDAYPAEPEDGYGWEKLFSERMCRHFQEDFGLKVRIARYHNVYGPFGTYEGGREKAPAAMCRKVLEARDSGTNTMEIWGDGTQTRSFMYVDDCVRGTIAIMESDFSEPLNLGSSELVTINQLVTIVENIAGAKLLRTYKLDAPKGVNGRNSDNTLIQQVLGWEPSISLTDGMARTFAWIESQVKKTRSAA
jgi:nucleoside-diphosphate-sugar epimerase